MYRRTPSAIVGLSCVIVLAVTAAVAEDSLPTPPTLEEQLLKEDVAALIKAARENGDATRGAIAFYQPDLTCTKCHDPGGKSTPLGPDLTKPDDDVTDVYLVESVLQPSKAIKKGYESVVVVTDEGKMVTGLLVENSTDELVLRDSSKDFEIRKIPQDSIDEQFPGQLSVMPTGMLNTLTSRQQFLDLIRYVLEIAEQGPLRAKQLRAVASLYAARPLPEYEKKIDHAGMIRGLNQESFKRGEAIYNRLCVNCHGTIDQPGSLPTSLRFATDKFKNGNDPHTMYQTLTKGFGMMVAQAWMVPEQKYDVIHYVRETYLKLHNPSQYATIDDDYLSRLPKGNTRGPKPSAVEPWVNMDYGPNLIASYEAGSDGSNFAYKGIAVRLDTGPGGVSQGQYWMLYDHDTMRVAAAWSGKGFIDWNGIMFNGRHAIHPKTVGAIHYANPVGPGWAQPRNGGFVDPRLRGRDDRPYGPLPRTWSHYKGLYHFGNQVIVEYTVGDARVLEMPGVRITGAGEVFTRTFNIGARAEDMVLQVARHPLGEQVRPIPNQANVVVAGREQSTDGRGGQGPLHFDGATSVEVAGSDDFDLTHSDYSICARIKTGRGGTIFCKTATDGPWVKDGKTLFVRGGKLAFDIGWVGVVNSRRPVDDDQWHDVVMTYEHQTGHARLYVDGRPDGQKRLKPRGDVQGHVVRLGYTSPNFPGPQTFFDGQISDVCFYQRALAKDEIASMASEMPDGDGLVARWRLDAVRGETVADETGNEHHGQIEKGTPQSKRDGLLVGGTAPPIQGATWSSTDEGDLHLTIPAGNEPLKFVLWLSSVQANTEVESIVSSMADTDVAMDLKPLTEGGPPRWTEKITSKGVRGSDDGPFAVDVFTHPARNPWFCRTRFTGFDFLPDGQRAAVCSWDGSVWLASGIAPEIGGPTKLQTADEGSPLQITWQRIASGLFQPLGLKVIDGQIYVACRDQIVILRDLNGDGETDFYENFNNDHQVTEHFHEFAMDLQIDAEGNFYYAKAARHAKDALVPQHGTLLRVAKDGSRTDILAKGFRAPNGVCVNPDGTFFLTDQEGHWTPENRINLVTDDGRFYGYMGAYHDVTDPSDDAMEQPVCWISNRLDRSPAELLWINSSKWGPLEGMLMNLSYGYGKFYIVLPETVGGQMQGGMYELPIPQVPTGVMRGRFHPTTGELYACGMFAWGGNQQQPGGFYRVCRTGKPMHLPTGLYAQPGGMAIAFTGELERESATNAKNYSVKTWAIHRSAEYGSEDTDEKSLTVSGATLSEDGRTVLLQIPDIKPTRCMEITYSIKSADGEFVDGSIHNTIHRLAE